MPKTKFKTISKPTRERLLDKKMGVSTIALIVVKMPQFLGELAEQISLTNQRRRVLEKSFEQNSEVLKFITDFSAQTAYDFRSLSDSEYVGFAKWVYAKMQNYLINTFYKISPTLYFQIYENIRNSHEGYKVMYERYKNGV